MVLHDEGETVWGFVCGGITMVLGKELHGVSNGENTDKTRNATDAARGEGYTGDSIDEDG